LVKPPVIIGHSIIIDIVIYSVAVCPTGQSQHYYISRKGDEFFQSVVNDEEHPCDGLTL
jgi:hypothetical protein